MRLCATCGHIESGHIVHRVETEPPSFFRGFCVIDSQCHCERFVPGADSPMAALPHGSKAPSATSSKERIAKMLADAAAATRRPERTDREILEALIHPEEVD